MKFEQIFCDSNDALKKCIQNFQNANLLIKTSSPSIIINSKKTNVIHLEKTIKGQKLKLLQKSVFPFTKKVFECLKKTKYESLSIIASTEANYFHRLLRKVACLEKEDSKKKTLIISVQTGNKELNELVNTKWEEVLKGKNFYFKTFNVKHYGERNLKIYYPSISDHLNINSFNTNFYFFYKRFKNFFSFKRSENIFLIFREDYLLREISGYLVRKGVELKFFKNPKITLKEFDSKIFGDIKKTLYPIILKHCQKWVLKEYLVNTVNYYFKALKNNLDKYHSYSIFFDDYLNRIDKKIVCATSYPALPIYIALSHQARKKKIKLISTQHGINREINSYYSEGKAFLENNIADLLFVNNTEGKVISDRSPFLVGKTKVVGTPKQMKSKKKLKPISSYFTKKIFYISTRTSSANFNMLSGFQTDYERVMEEKDLVKNVLSKSKNKIFYKAYPYKDYYVDRDPVHEEIDKIKNIELVYTSKDLLNYFDEISLIITSRATSTLSWCILANIPLIFIDHDKEFRLKNKARKIFKNSLIYFDKNQRFFNRDLLNYLSKPLVEIKKDWENKKINRKKLIEKYISSDVGETAGKVAADHLLKNNYFRKVFKCVE